jgi:hypothetical protein
MDELDKILSPDETAKAEDETQKKALEAKAEEEKKQDSELRKKQEQKSNLEKAIAEANAELKRKRDILKKLNPQEEEEVPSIDFNDPASKAWDKHIKDELNPVRQEQDKVKGEIFNYTFSKWLEDKPVLRDNPEEIKSFISDYDKVKSSTGLTREGVETDLDRAFAVKYSTELINRARVNRKEKVKEDLLFSEPAISRGATSYQEESEDIPSDSLSKEEREAVVRMYGSLDAYNAMMKKFA